MVCSNETDLTKSSYSANLWVSLHYYAGNLGGGQPQLYYAYAVLE